MSRKQARHLAIAEALQNEIETKKLNELPTLTELCKIWDVSYVTMWKAVKELEKKGIARARQGSGIEIIDAEKVDNALGHSASEIYLDIRKKILDGVFKSGRPLPKIDFFALAHKVSRTTIEKALHQLQKEKLVSSRNKRWYIGPDTSVEMTAARTSASNQPVVLIIGQDYNTIQKNFVVTYLSRFSNNFGSELESFGYRVQLAFFQPDALFPMIPSGFDNVSSHIRLLGNRYAGALLLCNPLAVDNLQTWVSMLCKQSRPAVLYDMSNSVSAFSRQQLGADKLYYHCFVDEQESVACALNALYERGHRKVFIPQYEISLFSWVSTRTRIFIQKAKAYTPAPKITTGALLDLKWEPRNWRLDTGSMKEVREKVRNKAALATSDDPIDTAIIKTLHLIKNEQITCFVAPNDAIAQQYFSWFSLLDIKVPSELSIISFDNLFENQLLPISTIDYGLGTLGYTCAHVFIGDIPVAADRKGNLRGKVSLIDRGSIAGIK